MGYWIFERESNNFKDILNDTSIKPLIRIKISWKNHLMIMLNNDNNKVENVESYIALKFGDSLKKSELAKNYTPIDGVDYISKVPPHLKNQRRK